jgi:hypothetical protein
VSRAPASGAIAAACNEQAVVQIPASTREVAVRIGSDSGTGRLLASIDDGPRDVLRLAA